jgi:hypothetical protein
MALMVQIEPNGSQSLLAHDNAIKIYRHMVGTFSSESLRVITWQLHRLFSIV